MALQQSTVNKILFGLLALAIIIGLVAIFWPKKEDTVMQPPINPPAPTSGLGGALGGILAGVFSGDWWKNLFGKKDEYPVVDCDPARPGYEKDGTLNPNCGKDYTGCVQGKCDPKRPGFDECGFLDINCGA